MFQYDQNVHLTQIHRQERLDEGERSRLAAETQPRRPIYGAVFAYALRKLSALEQALKVQPQQTELLPTSTQEIAAVR